MANLKDIRRRITSVQGTQKITKAMKMVAASKLRKAQESIEEVRPYAYSIRSLIKHLVGESGYVHPLMESRPEVKKVAMVVLTSDRGLCGGFNSNILRHAQRFWQENRHKYEDIRILTIGKKAGDFFKHRHIPVAHRFDGVFNDLDFQKASDIATVLTDLYQKGEVDAVHIVYNEFKSAVQQKVVDELLIPITSLDEQEREGDRDVFRGSGHLYEPGQKEILTDLVPKHIATQILRCLLESLASEYGARMTAMDSATNAASDMIDRLTLTYNRTRQAVITTEIMEIVGGAEALGK